jgi:amino acid adenylation domain-containing protein
MQAGLLYETLSGHSGNYVQQLTITCHESLDSSSLRRAWLALVQRHDALRTSFVVGESTMPRQRIDEEVELGVVVADWRSLTDESRERRWQELLGAERHVGFEPAPPPLMRVAICQFADTETRLLWSYHHAILDGRSRLALLRELFELYEERPSGKALGPPSSPPFEQFAVWAARRGSAPGTEAFWRKVLAGIDGPTPAPGAGSPERSSQPRVGGRRTVSRTLDSQLSNALREMASAHELTAATILQGAYALLLSQEADSDELLFATTRAGRRSAPFDTQDMIGLLMVTSPVRLRLQPHEALTEWFDRVRDFNVSVRDFEHAPLSELRRWSEIPRPAPIAETLFSYERASMNSLLRAADPAWKRRDVQLIEQLDFPLTLEAFGDEEILVNVLHDEQRVPAEEATRIIGRYEELVRACVENPGASVASVCEMTPERRRRLSGEMSDARAPTAAELVPARISRQIHGHPDRVAVEHGKERLTYAELGARVDELAGHLEGLGARPGTSVGIAMARTPELICSVLAVQRIGAAYVPLDPRYPPERLATMLEDSGAEVLMTDARSRDSLPTLERCAVLVVDALPATHPDVTSGRPVAPEDLSHLIFTSGSTGRPKAVMVEHRSVAHLTAWAEATFTDDERDGMLASTSLSFDLSVFEILVTLALGGRIVLVEDILALSDPDFGHEIAFVNSVPSALSELLRARELPGSVRTVALAGEALPSALVDRLYAQRSVRAVWNLYGPSEDTTYSTAHLCDPGKRPLIGGPLPGTEAYVVDRHLRPVREGVAGELLLGGLGLARGYLNRAELTTERFPEVRFSQAEPTRVYRTGDRAKWVEGGLLDYLGRADNQVKIRGVRVEPDELAHALREQEAIDDAAVVVRGDGAGRKLLAYVVGANGTPPDTAAVNDELTGRLPAALLPSAIVVLEALPLTPNGKLDRRALPEPTARTAATITSAVTDATQRTLAGIWTDVLDLSGPVGASDDFFQLGGDSLKALRLLVEVEDRFGRRLPLEALFTATTLAAQSAAIDSARAARVSSTLIPVRPTGRRAPWICVLTDHRGVVGLRNLLPAMLSDQPVYALQAIDPAAPSWRSSSVEQIAQACLDAVRSRYPEGPYRLGGHSLGGLVAFDMARRLIEDGERVQLLMLLDTLAPETLLAWADRRPRPHVERPVARATRPRTGASRARRGFGTRRAHAR